jgi:SAM-dependent methyltransferase
MAGESRSASSSPDAWVSGYFGEDYRDSVEPLLTAERTSAEVSFLLATTGLRPPGRVVDLGCGHGRHALELARRGFDVTGVDVNAGALALAGRAATSDLAVRFVHADYASPPAGPFDLAVSLFGSFGFSSDEANERTVLEWCSRVRAGGWMVLELWHRDLIVTAFEPRRTWRPSESLEVDERRVFDPLSGRLHVRYDYAYADGRRTGHDIRVRLYTAAEIRQLLGRGGVRVAALFGSLRGDAYAASSRYLVVVGQRTALPERGES